MLDDPPPTDAVQRARSGDEEALTTLLQRYGAGLLRDVQRSLPPRWHAEISPEDIVQLTFTEAFLKIRQLNSSEESVFVAWLSHIASNNLSDAVRAFKTAKRGGKWRRWIPPSGARADPIATRLTTGSRTPSQRAGNAELEQALQDALATLPEHYRLAVQWHDLEGKSVQEVATQLNRSYGAVCILLKRARDRLRELLAGYGSLSRNSA